MNEHININLVKDTFSQIYNEEQFSKFIKELLPGADFDKAHQIQMPNEYKDFIKSAKRICKYKYQTSDFGENVIDVLQVKLKRTSSLDRARTAQRNFVARYLNGSRDYQKDAALVAFISEDDNGKISEDWRFSLIKMDYVTEIVEDENGIQKRKTSKELTPAKRFSFLVGINEGTHTAQKQLKACLDKAVVGEQITLEDLVKAFDIEKVSKEFFDEYKKLYIKMKDELARLYESDSKIKTDFDEHNIIIEDFAKKTMGQLVFLYFIQKKGWLGVARDKNWGDGDKKFLRNLLDKKYGEYENFFNDILEHLFYEALASDRGAGAWFEYLKCRIPFLNGGLFEPVNGYKYDQTDITIDNKLFDEIFNTFDLYNFTVKEDEPLEKEVAIDPEMLGKVFENLLPENIRKGNGAFYTPREIVHYMCQESLINYLYNKINVVEVSLTQEEQSQQLAMFKKEKRNEQLKLTKEVFEERISKEDLAEFIKKGDSTYTNKSRKINANLSQAIEENAAAIDNALKNIKICDPAIGSGAFPVGMMNEVVRARMALNVCDCFTSSTTRIVYNFKREVIENSIYGVDLDASAVEIAKLRFWLSLVVDEDDAKNIKPLPNLDYKIMQGNSLITSYEGIDFDEIVENQAKQNQLSLLAGTSMTIMNQIKAKQDEFLKTPYATKKIEVKQKIQELIFELVRATLEERTSTMTKDAKQEFNLEEHIRNFAQNTEKRNFFPWKLFFADVFENGGFDVVIGNPPYVDSETMINRGLTYEREYISQKYISAKGNWDLFIAFCELSLNIGKSGSINSFIIPNKILATKYSEKIRELFSLKQILEIRDYSRINVFAEAAVYPIVYILHNDEDTKKSNVSMCKINEDFQVSCKNIIEPTIFYQDILWDKYFQEDAYIQFLIKVSKSKKLNKYSKVSISAAATVGEAYKIKEVLQDIEKFDATSYKKLVNSGTIDKYITLWGNKPTQYIKGVYKNPVVNNDKLKAINETRLIQAKAPKIIIANMTREIEAYFDSGECAAAKSTTIITGEANFLKFITALLNSKLLTLWYQINYNSLKMSGEALSFGSNEVGSIPIIEANQEQENTLVELVNKIIAAKQSNLNADTSELERQIDELVYKLYGLTEEEILLIEPDRLVNLKFSSKPSVREIVEKISKAKPSLMDDDREFCFVFDKIALNNGFSPDELPSYWTIGRSIFNYKKDNNISADIERKSTSALKVEPDIPANILAKFRFDESKPSIKKILQAIGKYDIEYFDNDRKLVELFDAIAITNGYPKTDLPKYWNIIRSMFDCKKELKNENLTVDSPSAVQKL